MPYRATERTEASRLAARQRIARAARGLIAGGGYRAASVAAVAAQAGVATGTVYRHFPSKADLFAEVFRTASQHEVDATRAAADAAGPAAPDRLAAAGELPAQNVAVVSAALVGALGEALVGPLSPVAPATDPDALAADLVAFCLRSVQGAK